MWVSRVVKRGITVLLLVPDLEAVHSGAFDLVRRRIVADGAHRARRMLVSTKKRKHKFVVVVVVVGKAVRKEKKYHLKALEVFTLLL